MIASWDKNFIFIKTKKTAGTSLEISLSQFCGKNDIITPIAVDDEMLRIRFGVLPRNFCHSTVLESIHRIILKTRLTSLAAKTRDLCDDHSIFWDHMGAKEIKEKIGTEFWYRAKKISIDRHPYEKVVSLAYYNIAKFRPYEGLRFEEIIDHLIEKEKQHYRNFDRYTIDGELAVDYLMKYEDLVNEIDVITNLCDLPKVESLPKAKSGLRKDNRSAFQILTINQRKRIQETCKEEFELLGYET